MGGGDGSEDGTGVSPIRPVGWLFQTDLSAGRHAKRTKFLREKALGGVHLFRCSNSSAETSILIGGIRTWALRAKGVLRGRGRTQFCPGFFVVFIVESIKKAARSGWRASFRAWYFSSCTIQLGFFTGPHTYADCSLLTSMDLDWPPMRSLPAYAAIAHSDIHAPEKARINQNGRTVPTRLLKRSQPAFSSPTRSLS